MKLSFIVPTYNNEYSICTCIDSILKLKTSNYEIIIINDGSTDKTLKFLEKYSSLPNIKIINQENFGTGKARNIGIKESSGDWLVFVDADDLLCVEEAEKIFDQLKDDYDIVMCSYKEMDFDMKSIINVYMPEQISDIKFHIPKNPFYSNIYKRKFVVDNSIYFYEHKEQDIESAFRYLTFSKAKSIYQINNLNLIINRINSLSNTHTWIKPKMLKIKSIVYYDLYLNYALEEDKKFLIDTCINCILLFYKNRKQLTCDKKKQVQYMNSVTKNIFKSFKRYLNHSKKHIIFRLLSHNITRFIGYVFL